MNITPEQARELLDVATPGPWGRTVMGALTDTDGKVLVNGPDGNMDDSDADLASVAPDLAQTIAGMEYEYRTEEWSGAYWYPCELWTSDLSQYDGYTERKGERLVRRLVGPVETIEETPND